LLGESPLTLELIEYFFFEEERDPYKEPIIHPDYSWHAPSPKYIVLCFHQGKRTPLPLLLPLTRILTRYVCLRGSFLFQVYSLISNQFIFMLFVVEGIHAFEGFVPLFSLDVLQHV
jgi:hypothetical protein